MGRRLLSEGEIASRLAEVPSWTRVGDAIRRTWRFRDFPEALAFVRRVGALAEKANHHPDIFNSYSTVILTLTTHDAGGLTDRDFDLAKRIDGLSRRPPRR